MKRLTSVFTTLTILVMVFLSSTLYAQDSTRTRQRDKDKFQIKEQKKEQLNQSAQVQKRNQANRTQLNDANGDGIPNGQNTDYSGMKSRSGHGTRGFVDSDGDGINDNSMDADGDGIPNGQDSDFTRPQDGTGRQMKYGSGSGNRGNGTGNQGIGPRNGNGMGQGTGTCDGTGPKGSRKGGKK